MKYGYGTEARQEDHFIPLFVMRKEESDEAKYYYVGHVAAVNDLHTITRKTCLWSNKAVRCRHLFWTVMAFILDSVGGRHRCDMRAPVPLVS